MTLIEPVAQVVHDLRNISAGELAIADASDRDLPVPSAEGFERRLEHRTADAIENDMGTGVAPRKPVRCLLLTRGDINAYAERGSRARNRRITDLSGEVKSLTSGANVR